MTYRIPPSLSAETDALERQIDRFGRNEISDAELKALRVPFGIYEQRTRGRYMARMRCAAGMISPSQLSVAAELAVRYGSGRLHVTTRQELQMHDLPLAHLISVLRGLYSAGLATRGGGGNTVRNITASWDSGVATGETFDVTPYAVELTSRMIALPGSWLLPRKFKIAFSNSSDDSACATVSDVGFVATRRNGRRGFRVFAAGGMGRAPRTGQVLHEFIDGSEVFEVAEAVKRLFSRYGNRRNKHTARLRFLWATLGRDGFVARYEEERRALREELPEPFSVAEFTDATPPHDTGAPHPESEEFLLWKRRFCTAQRQQGLWLVRFPLSLGDIHAGAARDIASAVANYGDDCIRLTPDQNIAFRNLPSGALPEIYDLACRYSPLSARAVILGNAVACAGASTCQLGICLSRGALDASIDALSRSLPDLDALEHLRIHFSGCLNSCGRHAIADIGFSGKASRKDGHAYPVYSVVAGSSIDGQSGATLAKPIGDIPARAVPKFLTEFLARYLERKAAYDSYRDFLAAEGADFMKSLCERLGAVPSFSDDPQWYCDWGAQTAFSLEGRGTGECASGLFDLVELDLAKAREAREKLTSANDDETRTLLRETLFYSARALLVTKTGEIARDSDVPRLFSEHFAAAALVPENAEGTVRLLSPERADDIVRRRNDILSFADMIGGLYASLDESLQVRPQRQPESPRDPQPDLEADFRGVACPMNFVRTKMALSRIAPGQVLRVLLDGGEPVDNVPASAQGEGHMVLGKTDLGGYWAVLIRKGGG